MTLTFGRILADAWSLFRREADLVVRVVAPFVFLPAFAVQLLTAPLPPLPEAPRDEVMMEAWLQAVGVWGQANAIWYVLASAIALYGLATLALLLLDSARPDVRAALGKAARLFPRFALAGVLVAIPTGLGMWIFILPGLYMQARLIATVPALAAEQPLAATRGLARSMRMTRGAGFAILGAVVALFLLQWLAISPLAPVEAWLRVPGRENPFVLALVDALLVAIASAYQVAILVIGVVVYRRLGSRGI